MWTLQYRTGKGSDKSEMSFSEFVSKELNQVPCYTSIVCKPNNVGLKPDELNTFPGFRANCLSDDEFRMDLIQPILTHIKEVWANNDDNI